MKHTFTLKGLLMALSVPAGTIAPAQNSGSAASRTDCAVVIPFHSRCGDRTPGAPAGFHQDAPASPTGIVRTLQWHPTAC